MAHGTPDYGITNAARTTYQMLDMGELAVRLGSPVSYDRRGDVVWWDDFECGLAKWGTQLDGHGGSIALSLLEARNGQNSALFTVSATPNDTDVLFHDQTITQRSRLGVEVSICVDQSPQFSPNNVIVRVKQHDTANVYVAAVMIDYANFKLWILNNAGAFVQVSPASFLLSRNQTLWHTVKLVWDANTHAYVRLLFDDQVYDISGFTLQPTAFASDLFLDVSLIASGNGAAISTVFVDDFIMTQNEP